MIIHTFGVISFLITVKEAAILDTNDVYRNLIKSNLDASQDPCEDFYAYSCGNWHSNYNGTQFIDMPGYMDYNVNQQLENLMKNFTSLSWQTSVGNKAKDLYDSCKNIELLALNPFLRAVHRDLNMQWPIFAMDEERWANSTNFDWLKTVAVLRNYGLNFVFITHNVNVSPRNSSRYFLEISQHSPSSNLDAEDVENIYTNFGLERNESKALSKELKDFEMTLNGLVKYEFVNETVNLTYADNFQYYKLSELQNLVKEVDWLKYFQITLNTTENLEDRNIQVFVMNPQFYSDLQQLLSRTSNETLAHYLMLRFLYHVNDNLPHVKPRNCIRYMRGFLPVFMNFLYEEYEFKEKRLEVEKKLKLMFNNLRHSFEEMVAENHLNLSKIEQKYILKELQTMQLKIGNLPRNCSEQFVDSFYATLAINKSDFIQNHINILKFKNRLDYDKLSNEVVSIDQKVYNLDVDSLSSSSPVKIFDNAILVPYGYLQLPLFDSKLDKVYQYSLMGVVLAHEIIHAFDLFHIIYDYNSNYDWLGSQVVQHYYPQLHCLARSPVEVISENMADISGLRMAYNFYQTLMQNVDFTFGNLTGDQFFFVNSVQFLCGDVGKITALNGKSTDLSHDMHDIRVRQNWSKFEKFSLAFNCSALSNMSPPKETCRLW